MLEYQSRQNAVAYFQYCHVSFLLTLCFFTQLFLSFILFFFLLNWYAAILSSTYSHTCAINKIGIGAYNRRTTSRAVWLLLLLLLLLLFSSSKGIGLVQSGPRQKVKVCITSKQNCCVCVRVCLSMFWTCEFSCNK